MHSSNLTSLLGFCLWSCSTSAGGGGGGSTTGDSGGGGNGDGAFMTGGCTVGSCGSCGGCGGSGGGRGEGINCCTGSTGANAGLSTFSYKQTIF